MFDINYLSEFSRSNCVAICAFLVPANILATSSVLLSCYFTPSFLPSLPLSLVAISLASLLFAHVATWLIIGVVMPPTFILLALGLICLTVNAKAIGDRQGIVNILQEMTRIVKTKVLTLAAK